MLDRFPTSPAIGHGIPPAPSPCLDTEGPCTDRTATNWSSHHLRKRAHRRCRKPCSFHHLSQKVHLINIFQLGPETYRTSRFHNRFLDPLTSVPVLQIMGFSLRFHSTHEKGQAIEILQPFLDV